MSDTPRTDAARNAYAGWKCGDISPEMPDGWSFARQLERELAQAKEQLAVSKLDTARLNWIESQVNDGRFEIARSLLRGGYELGFWPKKGPVAEVHSGTFRAAIDKVCLSQERRKHGT